mmetsp:Transcript_24389/g.76942  ORF Transcript_24389/g.76942 Transcript_24389/m.76942 type:complete len:397 (-) Transcript_24389:163-1353(-)
MRTVNAESSKASTRRGRASVSPICPSAKQDMARTGKVSSSRQPMSALTSPLALDFSMARDSAAQSRTSQLESFSASEIFAMRASSPMRPSAETAAAFGRLIWGGGRRPPPPTTRARLERSSLSSVSSAARSSDAPEAFSPRVASAFAAAALMPASSSFRSSFILGMASLAAVSASPIPPMAPTADARVALSLSESAATTALAQEAGALSPIAATASSAAALVRLLPSIFSMTSPIFWPYWLSISKEIPTKRPSACTAALCTSATGSSSIFASVWCFEVASISASAWQTLTRTSGSGSAALPATTSGSLTKAPRWPSASTTAALLSTPGCCSIGTRCCSYFAPFWPRRPMTVTAAVAISGSWWPIFEATASPMFSACAKAGPLLSRSFSAFRTFSLL